METLLRLDDIGLRSQQTSKVFVQVKIKEEDRRYLRFYCLRNPEDDYQGTGQQAVYHFNVDIFEFRASSFILAAGLQHHLQKDNMERTALDIERNILGDNLVTDIGSKQEEPSEGKPKNTLKTKMQQIGTYTKSQVKPEDALYKNNLKYLK